MPKPRKNESRKDFMARCIPIVMKEGAKQDAAIGKCGGIYDGHKAESEEEEIRQEDKEMLEIIERNKRIEVLKGGLFDGVEFVNDAERFRKLKEGSTNEGS